MKLSDQNDKFRREDTRYLERRSRLLSDMEAPPLIEVADHFGMYSGIQTIGRSLFVYETLKQTLNVPGHVMEFGVWKGANLMFMAKTLSLLAPSSPKLVIGFDNFSGLPEPTDDDGEYAKKVVGRYAGDEDRLKLMIEVFGYEDYVHLVVGDACETIPQFEEDNNHVLVSLAYIDFDLYAPVRTALAFLEHRLAVGGIILFDEAISALWPGETQALLEFLETSGQKFEMFSNTVSRQPVMGLRRIS